MNILPWNVHAGNCAGTGVNAWAVYMKNFLLNPPETLGTDVCAHVHANFTPE